MSAGDCSPSRSFEHRPEAMGLVKKLRTYAYDAYMLICAQQIGTRLPTLDDALKVHAESLGIDILEI